MLKVRNKPINRTIIWQMGKKRKMVQLWKDNCNSRRLMIKIAFKAFKIQLKYKKKIILLMSNKDCQLRVAKLAKKELRQINQAQFKIKT